MRSVALNSGFDRGETLLLLQVRDLSYVVPLHRLLDWLRDEVRKRYKEERSIDLGPLPKEKNATVAA